MNCPVCRKSLITLELNAVEIDHCLTCKGTWLDAGELEIFLEGAEAKNDLLSSFHLVSKPIKEKKRQCPICDRRMQKVFCGKAESILLDRCPKNDGLWFDRRELEETLSLCHLGKDSKVADLLKDMFGKK